jgi:hypothetical protein
VRDERQRQGAMEVRGEHGAAGAEVAQRRRSGAEKRRRRREGLVWPCTTELGANICGVELGAT